jgi:hypothetical protein
MRKRQVRDAYRERNSLQSPPAPPQTCHGSILRTRHRVPPTTRSASFQVPLERSTYGKQDVSHNSSDMLVSAPGLGVPLLDGRCSFLHPLDQRVKDVSNGLVVASPFVQGELLEMVVSEGP